jgi:hypothetical protein
VAVKPLAGGCFSGRFHWDLAGTLREIALSYNVDHATIHRLKARYAAEV